jgi:hypothetical protein
MADLFADFPAPPSCGPYGRPPAQRHSRPSVQAAKEIEPLAGTLRARVLAELRAAGPEGLTDEELQERLAMGASTQRPRQIELFEAGLVRDSGRTRPAKSGRAATVWVVAGVVSLLGGG